MRHLAFCVVNYNNYCDTNKNNDLRFSTNIYITKFEWTFDENMWARFTVTSRRARDADVTGAPADRAGQRLTEPDRIGHQVRTRASFAEHVVIMMLIITILLLSAIKIIMIYYIFLTIANLCPSRYEIYSIDIISNYLLKIKQIDV